MFNKRMFFLAVAVLSTTATGPLALAAISPEEAARLGGSELTPVGAERAGNAAGTIPEWDGGLGLDALPAGWTRGQDRPDFFANDEVQYVIDVKNWESYADKLTEGQVRLIQQYPENFKMKIYPTRRSAAWPEYVYDNIKKNATSAQLREGGNGVENVWAAIPFPIPKNGNEVIWNHNTRFVGTMRVIPSMIENVIYNNGQQLLWRMVNHVHYPYYDPNASSDDIDAGVFFKYSTTGLSPVRDAGIGLMALENIDAERFPRRAWTYDPGERRVRRAPNLAFDTPDRPINVFDDYDMFSGSTERYNWNLLGKREIFVPYNNNAMLRSDTPYEQVYTPITVNPDVTRWELHRVWVVEAALKDGKRHVYSKRTFYIDEDTWTILLTDKYDGNGDLWRIGQMFMLTAAEVPASPVGFYTHYDLKVGAYYNAVGSQGSNEPTVYDAEPVPSSYYTPAALGRRGK